VIFAGLVINSIGFLAFAVLALDPSIALLFSAMAALTFGDGLVQPALNTVISKAAPIDQQGRLQGANQSQQSIARMIGPIAGAALYVEHPSGPYFVGGIIVLSQVVLLWRIMKRPSSENL
jgi:DHA1 family tetracycline resistance protein-like MFS transporter